MKSKLIGALCVLMCGSVASSQATNRDAGMVDPSYVIDVHCGESIAKRYEIEDVFVRCDLDDSIRQDALSNQNFMRAVDAAMEAIQEEIENDQISTVIIGTRDAAPAAYQPTGPVVKVEMVEGRGSKRVAFVSVPRLFVRYDDGASRRIFPARFHVHKQVKNSKRSQARQLSGGGGGIAPSAY